MKGGFGNELLVAIGNILIKRLLKDFFFINRTSGLSTFFYSWLLFKGGLGMTNDLTEGRENGE